MVPIDTFSNNSIACNTSKNTSNNTSKTTRNNNLCLEKDHNNSQITCVFK